MSPLLAAGILFIGGGNLTDEVKKEFLDRAGNRLVVITTASQWADTNRLETDFDGIILHTRSRLTANSMDFVEPLKTATAVWFQGGDQNWLADTYRGTLTEREIRGVLERGGIVGGSSAGAAVMSLTMLPHGNGFGLLPGTIVDQHFTQRRRRPRLLSAVEGTDLIGVGIDEGTALIIENGEAKVFGNGQVHIYRAFSNGRTLPGSFR